MDANYTCFSGQLIPWVPKSFFKTIDKMIFNQLKSSWIVGMDLIKTID